MKTEPTRILLAWIGNADLQGAGISASTANKPRGAGPIAAAVGAMTFDRLVLLSDWESEKADGYLAWLRQRSSVAVDLHPTKLPSPTDYTAVFHAAREAVDKTLRAHAHAELFFHLSPGTPAMTVVWILLGKLRVAAKFIQSSPEEGVKVAEIPFDLAGDFLPDLLRARDEALAASVETPPDASFKTIIHSSAVMQQVIARARMAAVHALPVLLQGETGTGKELFAQAIHNASPRHKKAFVPINCAALPETLIESELFGYKKGAFSGAHEDRGGLFEQAHGGTLFLDEIGEVSPAVQVRLLRVLQEGRVRRIGESHERAVDVRVIAATHRDLLADVQVGRFREDLFYRLAVLALRIPALRERGEDIGLIADSVLARMNQQLPEGARRKKFARDAREFLHAQRWPGNVRELQTTLQRAMVWTTGNVLHAKDLESSMLTTAGGAGEAGAGDRVLGRALGDGFDLRETLDGVARDYLKRAMQEAKGNKTQAAVLLGLPSYQTLTNWLAKYRIKG